METTGGDVITTGENKAQTQTAETQDSDNEDLQHLKDGKRAWIVCFSAFLLQVIIVGTLHVFGLFFVVFLDEFHCTKAEAGWCHSCQIQKKNNQFLKHIGKFNCFHSINKDIIVNYL